MTQEILLVEDDASLNRGVSLKLQKEGYIVHSADSLHKARELFEEHSISLIICDIGLPDGSGLDFCTEIRQKSNVLFLFLTAMDTEIDMVTGYEAGADDYITKPFSLMVLISKVHAILKRRPVSKEQILISGDITLNLKENRASKNGAYLSLTANEQKLLSYFMQNPLHILSKEQLLTALWDVDGNFVDENTIAVNIRRLREKIEDDPSSPSYIKNVRGLGYIWERNCERS